MAITYLRLFPATQQFELRNGQLDVAGQLKVFYEGTDDLAGVYDVDGSQLPQPVILDDNGRAQGLFVDSARVYRLEVYDRYGELLYTVRKMVPSGGGAGSALGNTYEIVSSDGSIEINSTEEGSKTTYDIGIAPGNSDEFLEWCKCVDSGIIDGPLYPTMTDGTMESAGGQGLHVGKDRFYHITSSFKVYPKGDGINYETLVTKLMFNDGEDHQVTVRGFDIDNSVHDPLLCEFSYDFKAPEDGYLFLDIDGASAFTMVGCELQVHRIYSGINAVPDTCATKPFVSANYQPLSGMSAYVNYSAIGGNSDNQITGINGSSIGATVDTATLTSYFISNSAFTSYSSNVENILINMENNVSDISSTVSGLTGTYLEQSASALFAPSGDYAYNSSVSGKVDQSAFDNCCSSMSSTVSALETSVTAISSNVSGLTGVYLEQSASSLFQPSGDYAYNSALSGKLDTSAFSGVSGNFVQNSAFTSYTASALTAIDNSISSIQSSMSSMSSDVSGKVDQSSMSAWIPYSALDYSGTAISGIGGSSLAGMGGGGADYTGIYPINVDNTAREIAVDSLPLVTDSSMTSYASGDSSVIGVNLDIMSGKLDKTAQVVTATATQLYAGTAYLTSVNGAPVSASRAGQAANASMATSAYYDGTGRLISSLPDRAEVSAIASAYATGGGGGVTYTSPSGTIVVAGNTLEGTNSAVLTAASGGYFNALSLATFPDVALSTTPTQLTYATLANTNTGGEFILDFDSPLYGGTLFISGRDSAYNTASASAELENGPYTASVPQGAIINQIYGWTDGSWLHVVGLTASAAPQVYASGVGKLAWESSVSSKLDTTAFSTVSGTFLTDVPPGYATKTYVDSSVSSKLDSSAFSSVSGSFLTAVPAGYASETYVDSSVSSKLDTSAFSAASGSFLTAVPAGYATEAYVDSSVSGKQDSSAMSAYLPFSAISADENSAITSINGSSVGGTQVVTATGSASFKVKTTGTGRTTSTAEFITGINGTPIAVSTLSANTTQIVENYILAFSPTKSMWTTADKASSVFSPLQYGTGAGLFIDNVAFRGYIKGNEYFVSNEDYGYVRGEVHQTRGCRTIAQSTASAYASIVAKSNSAYLELSGVGAAAPVQITPSSVTAWDTVTAKMDSTAVQSAYASASASQATAQGVLYILIPDGV